MQRRALIGTKKGLFIVGETGTNGRWAVVRESFLGAPVTMVMEDPRDGAWYVGLKHGHFGPKLHRSDDEGRTWVELGTPAYPKAEGAAEDEKPTALDTIWALEPGHSKDPGAIWCGTIPGGLFRSEDRGATWQLVESLWNHPLRKEWFGGGADAPGIHSVLIHVKHPDSVWVGVSCGGVWRSDDKGKTWNCRAEGMRAAYMPPEQAGTPHVQDPHRLAQCKANPDVIWAQHHNGVFVSRDGSASWKEIENVQPSVFGFAVAVHPKNPDVAWTVPAIKDELRIPVDGKVVVSRTKDGGKTWEVLRNGLPQEHAYDLVYRHALDVDKGGYQLMFGSTTGSVFVSNDGGDKWTTISKHLPPVFALRFVEGAEAL